MDKNEKNNYKRLQESKIKDFEKRILYKILDFIGVSVFLGCAFAISSFLPSYECSYAEGISLGLATLIGSGIMAGASGIGSAVSGKMNKRSLRYNREQAELNRQFQAEQAEIGREWQQQMYEQYETPAAKVRQYLDAGLNPALMYQGASVGSMPSTSIPSGSQASAPTMQMPDFSGLVGIAEAVLGLKKMDAEIDNIESNTNKTNQETSNLLTNKELMESGIVLNYKNASKIDSEIEKNSAEIKEIASRINLNEVESLLKNYSIDEVLSRIKLNDNQIDLINSQIGYNEAMLKEIESRIKNIDAQTVSEKNRALLIDAQKVVEQYRKSLIEEQTQNENSRRVGITRDNIMKLLELENKSVAGDGHLSKEVAGLISVIGYTLSPFNADRVKERKYYRDTYNKEIATQLK